MIGFDALASHPITRMTAPIDPSVGSTDTVPSVPRVHRMIDLFAGCGGLTCGFVSTGRFRSVAAVEQDLAAAATYAANFGEDHIHHGEIEGWVGGSLPEAEVVVGGPPCQGFSNLGKRLATDPRNELWRHYMNVLLRARPRAFLLENVDRFGKSDQFQALQRETDPGGLLQDYEIDAAVVRATDFGSAQLRRRFIVIGTHRDLPKIEIPEGSVPREAWRTVGQALEGIEPAVDRDERELPSATIEHFGQIVPGEFKSPDLHITRHYTATSLARFACIPEGGNRLNLPDRLKAPCWIGHDKGSLDVMGRLRWDRPSVTIRTEFFKPEKGRYLHPEQDRAITHREAARIQGFPDEFKWCGSKIQIARQIGNAVPIELARALADHISGRLE